MEASTKAQVTMDIVHVEGRTIEGVKVMGLLPESAYANGADFNIYVRWDGEAVRATRSDTDETIGEAEGTPVKVAVTKAGKFAAFAALMQALANHYGLTVVAQADPGIKGAHALKLVGTWAPDVIEVDTTGVECLCDEIFAQRKAGKVLPIGGIHCPGDGSIFVREGAEASDQVIAASDFAIRRNQASEPFDPSDPGTWGMYNLPAGWAWVESAECDGEFRLFTPEGTDHTQALSDLRQAQAAQRLADATATLTGLVGQVLVFDGATERIVTRVEANTVWLVTVGQDQAKQYPLVGLYDHLTQGRIVALDASDVAEGIAQAWAEAGSPRCAHCQRPMIGPNRDDQVTPFPHECVTQAELDAMAARLAAIVDPESVSLVVVPALPIRTPGASWDLIEAEIWAGTDMVEPMRRSRLSRKGKKALERAFRERCCGQADHDRWCRMWRPITKRHARLMGIDRKDAALLRPKFADLLAVRVGK